MILTAPNEILRTRSSEISKLRIDPVLKALYAEKERQGDKIVGLSAPQIGIPKRVILIQNQNTLHWFEMINPLVVKRSDLRLEAIEGCASLPDVRVWVRRPHSIDVSYETATGRRVVSQTLHEWTARVVLHEIDHLDGILITDYNDPLSEEELERLRGQD